MKPGSLSCCLDPPGGSLPAGRLKGLEIPEALALLLEPHTDPSSLASVDVGKSPEIPYVYVGHHGEVQNYKPLQVVTACSLDIYNFPFDVQNCSLTFTSWLHTSESRGCGGGVQGRGRDTERGTRPGTRSPLSSLFGSFLNATEPLLGGPSNGTSVVALSPPSVVT